MTYFNQDVWDRHGIFFKTEEPLEVFTNKQNFGEKEYNFLVIILWFKWEPFQKK